MNTFSVHNLILVSLAMAVSLLLVLLTSTSGLSGGYQ